MNNNLSVSLHSSHGNGTIVGSLFLTNCRIDGNGVEAWTGSRVVAEETGEFLFFGIARSGEVFEIKVEFSKACIRTFLVGYPQKTSLQAKEQSHLEEGPETD